MDIDLIRRGFEHSKIKKKWVLAFGALSFSAYGAYSIYNSPSVVKKRERLLKLISTFVYVTEMVSDSAEAIGIVSKDFKEFIQSDSDQIPNSLKQISKLSRSHEFLESLTNITRALTVGILRGRRQEAVRNSSSVSKKSDFSDKILDKLFSDEGSGFASVIVGSFARNLVMGYYSEKNMNANLISDGSLDTNNSSKWIEALHDDKCRELIGDCVQRFISTAVSVFLDKTMHINTYEELFSGMTNPKHESQVREMLTSVCNAAVETLVKTSHQVLMNKDGDISLDSTCLSSKLGQIQRRDCKASIGRQLVPSESKPRRFFNENQDNGWMRKMSSTLAVPVNRRFLLDVTGRVTFESVRSFLVLLLEKISDALKKSLDAIHEEVIDMGVEVTEQLNRKCSAIFTICVSLCLHILNGPWVLLPN